MNKHKKLESFSEKFRFYLGFVSILTAMIVNFVDTDKTIPIFFLGFGVYNHLCLIWISLEIDEDDETKNEETEN